MKNYKCCLVSDKIDDIVEALSAGDAAETFAEDLCEGDSEWCSTFQNGLDVQVEDNNGAIVVFFVEMEYSTTFYASRA